MGGYSRRTDPTNYRNGNVRHRRMDPVVARHLIRKGHLSRLQSTRVHQPSQFASRQNQQNLNNEVNICFLTSVLNLISSPQCNYRDDNEIGQILDSLRRMSTRVQTN